MEAVFLIGAPPRAKVSSCCARSRARMEAFLASSRRVAISSSGGKEQRGERNVADNGGEQVVEIVRDSAGEQAELFERFGFAAFGFVALAFGNVAENKRQRPRLRFCCRESAKRLAR